jgi:hypothetical protein
MIIDWSTTSIQVTQPGAKLHNETSQELLKYTVDRLNNHRVDIESSTVEFEVKWMKGDTTWQPERDLQEDTPRLVADYWKACGGRDKATKLELFHVFKILRESRPGRSRSSPEEEGERQYVVQWVGYTDSKEDTTVETESTLKEKCPDELAKFIQQRLSTKKRKSMGRRGGHKGS